ncbi:MAG TPA: CHAT domain-containing protein [Vicinamibacteria bacterium]|nr:CHAT domain-containing protein [Vicinamibacteria bacterium]
MDEHLASCPICGEVFAETVRFLLEEEEAEDVVSPVIPFVRRKAFLVPAALAAAAALAFVAFRLPWRRSAPSTPMVAALAEAMGTERFVEPRLTGGFRHGPLVVLRGEAPHGLDAYPPAVLGAVARVRERAAAEPSPEALGALGVTYLVSGDVGAAVKALESATAQAPRNPRLLSDLSAAYLVRASRLDEPSDVPRALEAAEKAIALDAPPAEAWFNRALALESLHLVDAARKAWQDYLARDAASGWADEARRHLEGLAAAHQSSVEEDKGLARTALREGPAAVDRLAQEAPSALRAWFQDELLPAWADATLEGRTDAADLRAQAQVIGDALLARTGDALARDAARALEPSSTSPDALRAQASGYRALHEAERLADLQQSACETFREAHRLLDEGGSPYALHARERGVTQCLDRIKPEAALAELDRVEVLAQQHSYGQLVGRARWVQGYVHVSRGELAASLERYRLAYSALHAARDPDSESFILSLRAENLRILGDGRGAWSERTRGLALIRLVRSPRYRYAILEEAAITSLEERRSRSALHFQTAVVEVARRWSRTATMIDAFVQRAALRHALGSDDLAAADLAEARRLIPQIGDRSLGKRFEAEADAVEGQTLANHGAEQAAASLGRALGYFQRAMPARVPPLRLLLARAQASRGLDDAVEQELEAGIEELERQRVSLRDAALQASFFDQALPLFDDMVDLQLEKRRKPERALAFVERGRARQLADSLAGPPAPGPAGRKASARSAVPPPEPESLRHELPEGVALVYYASRPDRLLTWVLTRNGCRFVERPVPADELRRLAAAYQAAVEERADPAAVREPAARLYDEMVRPLAAAVQSEETLILVPDLALQTVAFGSLYDRETGRYLVEDHVVGFAPSGAVFVRASAAAGAVPRDPAPAVLAVGNPRLDRDLGRGLPSLPGAEAEAAEIARLYEHAGLLTGSAATKGAFLERMRTSWIVHFAGHAGGGDLPGTAHLLLAPDPARADTGALYVRELDGKNYSRTRVVVLAACRSGAGVVSRAEGAWSLARPFLAAGVPSVVASLWDVDDAVSRTFFVAFHRALIAEGDPLIALRRTQVALLHDRDASLSHPATWAGFACIGGLDPRARADRPPKPSTRSL